MTDTHPCDACGGTGFRSDDYVNPELFDRSADYWSALDCPVCLGAGSFSDRMPAADALADAETLRRVAWDTFPSTRWFEIHGEDGVEARANVLQNGLLGRDSKTGALLPPTGVARWTASLAARAAFRAVPGLRGE